MTSELYVDPDALTALDMLHHAIVYVRANFNDCMSRDEAEASLAARVILSECSGRIFMEQGA